MLSTHLHTTLRARLETNKFIHSLLCASTCRVRLSTAAHLPPNLTLVAPAIKQPAGNHKAISLPQQLLSLGQIREFTAVNPDERMRAWLDPPVHLNGDSLARSLFSTTRKISVQSGCSRESGMLNSAINSFSIVSPLNSVRGGQYELQSSLRAQYSTTAEACPHSALCTNLVCRHSGRTCSVCRVFSVYPFPLCLDNHVFSGSSGQPLEFNSITARWSE